MSYTTSSPHQCVFVKVGGKKVGELTGVIGPVNFEVSKGKSRWVDFGLREGENGVDGGKKMDLLNGFGG